MERYQQIYNKVEHQQNVISRQNPSGGRLLKKKMHSVKSMGRRFEREKEQRQKYEKEEAIEMLLVERFLFQGKTVIDFALPYLQVGERILANDVKLRIDGNVRKW